MALLTGTEKLIAGGDTPGYVTPQQVADLVLSQIPASNVTVIGAAPVATIEKMLAMTGASGAIRVTGILGTAAPDGRAGDFLIDPSDKTTAADGGIVFVLADGARAKRQYSGYILPEWFGAKADSAYAGDPRATDNYAAFTAAEAYAFARGATVYMRAGGSTNGSGAGAYQWKTPIVRRGHWIGDGIYVDSGKRGTLGYFAPDVPSDTAGFEVMDYSTSVGITVWTNDAYTTTSALIASGWMTLPAGWDNTAGKLPLYGVFKKGSFAWRANGRATLENCSGKGKHGFVSNSAVGHINTKDCLWSGAVTGLHVQADGQDNWFQGGGCDGLYACMSFTENGWAGRMDRVHFYHRPKMITQLLTVENTVPGTTGGFFLDARSMSLEGMSEANIEVRDTTYTHIRYDGYGGMSLLQNSVAATELLPEAFIAAAYSHRFGVSLGIVSSMMKITMTQHQTIDAPPAPSGAQSYAARIAGIQYPLDRRDIDLSIFSSIYWVNGDQGYSLPEGPSKPVNSTEFARQTAIAPVPNLLKNPEVVSNLTIYQPAAVKVTAMRASALRAAGIPLTFDNPREAAKKVGADPVVLKVVNTDTSGSYGFDLPPAVAVNADGARPVCMSYYVALDTVSGDFSTSTFIGSRIYNASKRDFWKPVPIAREFQRVVNANQGMNLVPAAGLAIGGISVSVPPGCTAYICGMMLNFGEEAPYNPLAGPAIDGKLFLTGATVTTIGGVDYVTVNINGVDRQMALK